MSYHNNNGSIGASSNTYADGSFVKEKDGVVAPLGFHYMPNGKLMSDADHIAVHGYIEKTISGFDVDAKDISYLGEAKTFTIQGDEGAVFSLEIYDDAAGSPTLAPNYYNFDTKTWSSSKSGLNNIELNGSYSFSIKFPAIEFTDATCVTTTDATVTHGDDDGKIVAGMTVTGSGVPAGATVASVTSDLEFELSAATTSSIDPTTLTFAGIKKYTIDLNAKTVNNIKTKHTTSSESRNLDNTVNLNKSTGSSSDLIRKIIYQDIKKNLYLSCIAPSLTNASTNTVAATTSSTQRITIDNGDASSDVATNKSVVQVGDKVTETGIAASLHALVTEINPDGDNTNEIEIGISDSVTNNATITFTPAFNGMTPNGTVSTTGQQALEVSSGHDITTSFSITCTALAGRTLTASKIPTTNDLCTYTTVTFESAALALQGEDTDSAAKFFRWPITNIAGLQDGMTLDPARTDGGGAVGVNTTTPATISKYSTTSTGLEIVNRKYYTDINSTTITDFSVNGVDSYNNPITAINRNNIITAQAGNITFNVQQADALKSDANVRIFAYGADQIKSLTGMEVALSNIVITPTQISTTTTAAVNNSTTIPVTEAGNISTVSTVRGASIDSSVANPSVSLKSTTSGAANLTVSTAQTLENGQTLFFDGASNIVTITGTITVKNMNISDTTLYLDVERFLLAR